MHIVLTDILTCPRCGPEYGLILLADRLQDRRVIEGAFGCSNCREKYPIRNGVGVFGAGAEGAVQAGERQPAAPEESMRLAALLGVTHGPGFLVLAGAAVAHARALADLVEDSEVVAIGQGAVPPGSAGEPGLNRLQLPERGSRLPLSSGRVLAVALTGGAADTLLEEGARVLSPVGRLVLDPAPEDAEARLAALRFRVLAQQNATVVAARYV